MIYVARTDYHMLDLGRCNEGLISWRRELFAWTSITHSTLEAQDSSLEDGNPSGLHL